jgi:hypothetical protein
MKIHERIDLIYTNNKDQITTKMVAIFNASIITRSYENYKCQT